MVLVAYLLREYANEPTNIARIMLMCLLHDTVETDVGDTYVHGEAAGGSRAAGEAVAAERIFRLLPEDQMSGFRVLFVELNAGENVDAYFARAMGNLRPLLLSDSNSDGDWKEHVVAVSQAYGRQRCTLLGSVELLRVMGEMLQRHIAVGHIRNEAKEGGNA